MNLGRSTNARTLSPRVAFTLLELLLVLSILAVAFAIAMPTYDGMITSRLIHASVESVRLELQKARIEAIRTGQAQMFRCQVGQNQFMVQPWLKASDTIESGAGATVVMQSGQAVKTQSTSRGVVSSVADPTSGQKKLETGIVFADAQIMNDMRSVSEQTSSGGLVSAITGWSQPIILYPDGSSMTAHVVIQDPRGRRMAIQLRGLTGQASVVDMPPAGGN